MFLNSSINTLDTNVSISSRSMTSSLPSKGRTKRNTENHSTWAESKVPSRPNPHFAHLFAALVLQSSVHIVQHLRSSFFQLSTCSTASLRQASLIMHHNVKLHCSIFLLVQSNTFVGRYPFSFALLVEK
jgi:hypothetical protein